MVGVEVGGDDRPSAIWPWVAKGAGSAGGPWGLRRIRRDLIVLAASLAVFAGCAVIVADGRVSPAERAVFYAINGLPGWLYRPMLAAQYLGVLGMPLIIAAGALVWRRWRLAAALVLVVPLKLVLERVAKQLVQRQRPGTTVPSASKTDAVVSRPPGKGRAGERTCRTPVFRWPVLRAMPVMILAAEALASRLAACHPDCGTTKKS